MITYVDDVVQESDSPFQPEELEVINAAHSFEPPFMPIERRALGNSQGSATESHPVGEHMWLLSTFLAQAVDPEPKVDDAPTGQAEGPEPDSEEPYTEMVITAAKSTRAAELALNAEIRELGYLPGVTLGARTQYLSPQIWKPRITVYHAGFVEVRGRRVTPMAPFSDTGLAGVSGVWQSKGQATGQEDRVRRGVEAEVRDWQDALRAQALVERQLAVRNDCVLLWEGQASPEVRRQALAQLWLNTSDTPEGATVRGIVLGFVDEVVQESGAPYTAAELEDINVQHRFAHPFEPIAY